jgi:phage head maturation protease
MSKEMIRKSFCGKVRSVDAKNHTVECVMSDETIDRYDEIIEVEAYRKTLKDFREHPVLLSSHRYSGDLRSQIGEWEKVWIEGKALIGRAKYYVNEGNPEADWGFKLAEKGIAAYSVGFIPIKADTLEWEKYEELKKKGKKVARRIFKEVELLETSQVLIPANPSSLQRSIDEGDENKDAAQYFLDNLEQLKDFSDIEITESDIADKFLVKDDTAKEEEEIMKPKIVKGASEETSEEVAGELITVVGISNEEVMEQLKALSTGIDNIVTSLVEKLAIEFETKLAEKLSVIGSSLEEVKTTLEDVISAVNVKNVVPNSSYIENVLGSNVDIPEVEVTETDVVRAEYDPESIKALLEALGSVTDIFKKHSNIKK